MSEESEKPAFKWRHPQEVMQLHQLKKKKKALQARFNTSQASPSNSNTSLLNQTFNNPTKRKNPFVTSSDANKRSKPDVELSESSDRTLFKLLHFTSPPPKGKENSFTSFKNILAKIDEPAVDKVEIKVTGESWIPVDWCLKTKLRLLSPKPIPWNQKLRISEEASGVTSFTRCLETGGGNTSSLDTSPNAKFHQCCLYWQQPSLPWLPLFPRLSAKATQGISSVATTSAIKDSLRIAWSDSLRSLFQLIRTRQCPYFYACANHFTVLFRAAGVSGFTEMHALVTPTTRGFRNALRQEEIEFSMPLKRKRSSDSEMETAETVDDEDDDPDEEWMESMGINSEDIKQINYTQAKINQRNECEVDNSEESLILVEGHEVQALYSFLSNCKSAIPTTGPYSGIPPTLLAPVAFNGATLSALKVRESKVHMDNEDFYSLDVSGPILPHTVHNLCAIYPKDNSMTVSFSQYNLTVPFSKVLCKTEGSPKEGVAVFREENLSDCGLTPTVLRQFCSDDPRVVCNVDCLKYTAETGTYAWT